MLTESGEQIGSPPRVWGQRAAGSKQITRTRFTPTCVGTTVLYFSGARVGAVHPHVCGDNAQNGHNDGLHDGSPPRVWGQQQWAV